jgi:hypothetical protein
MKALLFLMGICMAIGVQAQNVGIGTSSPSSNAKLDITATDKGLLIPRMDSVHRKTIPNTVGLLVYDSTTNSFWYNTGTAWQNMATATMGWSLTGNGGTDTATNFVGTIDNQPLAFKVNNSPAGRIGYSSVSIGEGSFNGKPSVSSGVTAIGAGALANLDFSAPGPYLSAFFNTAVGEFALNKSTIGQYNTAVGSSSLRNATTAINNTALGAGALQNTTTGINNTAVGGFAMGYAHTGSRNTIMGSGTFGTGEGDENTLIGEQVMPVSGNCSFNTAVGRLALHNNFEGNYNTALGYQADLFTISNSITNATAIGANAKVDASNKIRLGDANVTVVESNGAFNTVSDGRFKYNIQENVKGLDFILKLRPVTYQFDTKKQEDFTKGHLSAEELNNPAMPAAYNESNSVKRTGFIAQEVAAAAKKTGYDFDGVHIPATDKQYYSLSYASFVVPLVKAVQEQEQVIDNLKKQNKLLQQQNELILKRLEALENK